MQPQEWFRHVSVQVASGEPEHSAAYVHVNSQFQTRALVPELLNSTFSSSLSDSAMSLICSDW